MSDKQMTLDDLINLIKLDIKKLSNADGYYDLDNKYVVSGIITGLNDAIKHITNNRDALERRISGSELRFVLEPLELGEYAYVLKTIHNANAVWDDIDNVIMYTNKESCIHFAEQLGLTAIFEDYDNE